MSGHGFHWSPCNRASGAGLAVLAVGAAVVYVERHVIERVADDLLEIVLFSALAAVAIVIAAAVFLWRRYGYRPAPIPDQITAMQQARKVQAAQRPAIAAPAQHFHVHFHGAAQPDGVPAVLRAIAESQQAGEQQ